MLNLYGDKNQFNSHVGMVSKILSDPSIKFVFVDKIPCSSAAACFSPKENTVYLPAIDPSKLTEIEAQKVMGLSAHERKHVKLTANDALDNLNKEIEDSKKVGVSRGILHNLWQTIEDLRIELNDNYSYRGDLIDIHHVNNMFFEHYNNSNLANENPFAYLMECIRYRMLPLREEFFRTEFLKVPENLENYFNQAMEIMMDGRFQESLKQGKETTHVTLELAIEIEKKWAQENNKQEKEKEKEKEKETTGSNGNGDSSNSDIKDLNEKFEQGQAQNFMSGNALIDAVNEICEKLAEQIKEENKNCPREIIKQDLYISYGMDDQIIIAKPNKDRFEQVKSLIGPTITHVRDQIGIHLKALANKQVVRGLRRGQIDNSRLYKSSLGCKTLMMKKHPSIEYSTAIQIVVDLSGSMGHGSPLTRYQMAMQMSIILAEVFQLLQIPFEITGFNTGGNHRQTPKYEGSQNVSFRTEQINFHIFKAFEDDYSIENIKHRLGSIRAEGCNIDHEVIQWSAARLYKQKEKRKLQIVLSDGQPSGGGGTYYGLLENELIKLNQRIVKSGINQFAFGLQSECVSKFYKDYVVLEKLEELNSTALKIFVDFLMKGINNNIR